MPPFLDLLIIPRGGSFAINPINNVRPIPVIGLLSLFSLPLLSGFFHGRFAFNGPPLPSAPCLLNITQTSEPYVILSCDSTWKSLVS